MTDDEILSKVTNPEQENEEEREENNESRTSFNRQLNMK